MSHESLPLDLYKANTELQLRLAQLLQESGHRWLEAVQRVSADDAQETAAKIDGLLKTADWQSLATLPAESFWRVFQLRIGEGQTAAQIAVKNQAAFTTGLQQALQEWQKSVGDIVGGANAAQPLQDIFKQWAGTWQSAVAAAQGKTTKEA